MLNRRESFEVGLLTPMAGALSAFDAEVLRGFEEFVGPADTDVSPQGSLYDFVQRMWPIVEPEQAFVPNWHIQALCDHLEAVTRGEITHLLINIPPGCMKSLVVSVFWPAWEWASEPGLRFLCASYGEELAIRDSLRVRDIITSREFRDRWSHVRLRADQNQKRRFDTTGGGWRLATSVGGRGTGEHPDRIIIDDPHNVKQTLSDAERQKAIDWFDGTISTRGVSRNARVVVIMQRLHEKDLSGHILQRADASRWVHLCLPMQYEPGRQKRTPIGFTDPRTVAGELLWASMFTSSTIGMLTAALGSFRAAGQLQQRPAPAEGGIIKRAWWKYFDANRTPSLDTLVVSCDPNLKAKQLNDHAAIQVWGARGADRYLLRGTRGRWDLPELTRQVNDAYDWTRELFPRLSVTVLIEKTAAGPDVIALLTRKVPGIVGISPEGDKVQRVQAVSPAIESGNVFVPGAPAPTGLGEDTALTPLWVQAFLSECAGFPFGEDDQVDAMSQALLRLQSAGSFVGTVNAAPVVGRPGMSNAMQDIKNRKSEALRKELEGRR